MIGQGQKLSNEQIFATLNISPLSSVFTVIKGLDNKENDKVKNALQVLSEVQERGLDLNFFFANLLAFSRQLLFVRFGSKTLEQIQKEEGDYVAGEIKNLLSNKTPKLLSPVLSEILSLSEAKSSTSKVLGLEILLVS
jgi:DNA polymerase III gamma/tau subunit